MLNKPSSDRLFQGGPYCRDADRRMRNTMPNIKIPYQLHGNKGSKLMSLDSDRRQYIKPDSIVVCKFVGT